MQQRCNATNWKFRPPGDFLYKHIIFNTLYFVSTPAAQKKEKEKALRETNSDTDYAAISLHIVSS